MARTSTFHLPSQNAVVEPDPDHGQPGVPDHRKHAPGRQLGTTTLVVLLLLTLSGAAAAQGLVVASWNGRHLGFHNHKDYAAMARVDAQFDLVALQEVMHEAAVKTLVADLDNLTHDRWDEVTSKAVGNHGYHEHYAFIWRESAVHYDGHALLYPDPGHQFLRTPFAAEFTSPAVNGGQPFVASTVHIRYGHSSADRMPEIRALGGYWHWIGLRFHHEPRLLLGDFNSDVRPGRAWQPLKAVAHQWIPDQPTTLSQKPGQYASAYDHVSASRSLKITHAGIVHDPEWLGMPHRIVYVRVSDHAPVYVTFGATGLHDSPRPTGATENTGPTPAAVPTKTPTEKTSACIDLNHASIQRIEQLDHVGASRAKAIIGGRPWSSVDALTRIRGLSAHRVADIKNENLLCP